MSTLMREREVREALRLHPILADVDAGIIDDIFQHAEQVHYPPDKVLLREGEPARFYWLLLTGSLRVYYTSEAGSEITVKLFGAPAAFAEKLLLLNYTHTEDCAAVDDAIVLRIPKEHFLRMLDRFPLFMKNVLLDTSARFLIAVQHERALAFLSVPQRLAYLLLSYVRLYGKKTAQGIHIDAKLSQDELANGIGVARKSVTRTFAEWDAEGILYKSGSHYVVKDIDALRAKAPREILGIEWVAGQQLSDITRVK